ncbi:AP-1 complex subunit gamma-1 [Fusarium oxysporum f. sp. albedinis]|nr:AP-1 complex subunit gamma-1 [Fusarium oxysporum f. sp. albedinis]
MRSILPSPVLDRLCRSPTTAVLYWIVLASNGPRSTVSHTYPLHCRTVSYHERHHRPSVSDGRSSGSPTGTTVMLPRLVAIETESSPGGCIGNGIPPPSSIARHSARESVSSAERRPQDTDNANKLHRPAWPVWGPSVRCVKHSETPVEVEALELVLLRR